MNRIVVITGASSGIGKQTADYFKKDGDTVLNLSLEAVTENENYKCNVCKENEVISAINSIGEKYGRIDVVLNCAGFGISGALELIESEKAQNIFDVNALGTYFVNKHCIKYMKKGSIIINIASCCALLPLPFRGLYCSSKAGTNMLSHCFRLELKPAGIKVCSICPGDVKTNFTKNRIKNFNTNNRYENRIANAAYGIDKNEYKRMSADVVAKVIFKTSKKANPKPMRIVSAKMKLLYFIYKIVPLSWFLHFTDKFFGGHKNYDNNPYLTNKK